MNTDIIRTGTHRTIFACAFVVLGACYGAAADDTGTSTTPPDDTGTKGDTIAFEVVVEGFNDGVPYCGVEKPTTPHLPCEQEDLVILWTGDEEVFATLFADNVKLDPPAIDLDGWLAILSYLPLCQTDESRLHMDRVALSGDTLLLDEVLSTPSWYGEFPACIYTVVTIPDTVSFTDAEATLTKVWVETDPWKE